MPGESSASWSRVSSTEFEELCQVILGYLEFRNIRRVGGPGDRGRDIVCDYPVTLKAGIAFNQKWIVQCKHTQKKPSVDVIERELRRAAQHGPDDWLLMTSSSLSSATYDWLNNADQLNYSFRKHVLDGTELARILEQEPRLLPKIRGRLLESEFSVGHIYELMMRGNYEGALAALQTVKKEPAARLSYLRACCYSELARRSESNQGQLLSEAFASLAESLDMNYVAEVSRLKGWPAEKVFVEMERDSELEFAKDSDRGRFIGILRANGYDERQPRRQGKCLTGDTLVTMADGSERPIASVRVGEETRSTKDDWCSPLVVGRVGRHVEKISVINNRLSCSLTQPLLTARGWVKALELRYGDAVSTAFGWEPVLSIDFGRPPEEVHMIKLSTQHEFFANGYVVHNKL